MKKIILIIIALFFAMVIVWLITKGVCMPFVFWMALIVPIAIIVVYLGGGKNLF